MNFAIVNENSVELRKITDMLLAAFPGLVVYEFTKPLDVLTQMRNNILSAVFLDSSISNIQVLELVRRIRKLNTDIPVLVCAEDDSLLDEALWNGATEYFVKPLQPEQIKNALIK